MSELSDCQPVYSHAEEAVRRAYAKPRGNYGRMLSQDVYDGMGVFDKMVQDTMVKRLVGEVCTPIARDVFSLLFDDSLDDAGLHKLMRRLMMGLIPPSTDSTFALECFERWSGRRICDWKIMDIKQRARSWDIPENTLYDQSRRLRKDLNEIKEAGLITVRCKLQEMGLML